MEIVAFDDLDFPASGCGNGLRHLRPAIAGVGEDAFDEGEQAARLAQEFARSVAVLHIGGKNAHAEQETERIDEDVALAAFDLLARVITLRVERSPPF